MEINKVTPFAEKKKKLEEFFKTNVDVMLEGRKVMLEVEERNRMNKINRLNYRELKYEMDPFSWKLIKLPKCGTKAVIIEENDEDKNWKTMMQI
jgi:transcriptional regulator of met regulon